MKALGLNPAEQEVIDMTNEVANNGLVYFPDFCRYLHINYGVTNGLARQLAAGWVPGSILHPGEPLIRAIEATRNTDRSFVQ
jgi:hypothetical protein